MSLIDELSRNKRSHGDAPCVDQPEDKKFKAEKSVDEYGRDYDSEDEDGEDEDGEGEDVEENESFSAREKRENEEYLASQKKQYPVIHNHCCSAEERHDDKIRFESPITFVARNMIDAVLHSCNELCRKEPILKDCKWITLDYPSDPEVEGDHEPWFRSKDDSFQCPPSSGQTIYYNGWLQNTKNMEGVNHTCKVNLLLNTAMFELDVENLKMLKLEGNTKITFAFDILYLPIHKICHMGLTKQKEVNILSRNFEMYERWKYDLNPNFTGLDMYTYKNYYRSLCHAEKNGLTKPRKPSFEECIEVISNRHSFTWEKSIAMCQTFDTPLNAILSCKNMIEALQSYPFGYYERLSNENSYDELPAAALLFRMNKHCPDSVDSVDSDDSDDSDDKIRESADFIQVCNFVYERGWINNVDQEVFDGVFIIWPDLQRGRISGTLDYTVL